MNNPQDKIYDIGQKINFIAKFSDLTHKLLQTDSRVKRSFATSNVIVIDPKLVHEYKLIENKPIQFELLVSIFYDWAKRTYNLALKNRGSLKNKILREHIQRNLNVVNAFKNIGPHSPEPRIDA